MTLALKRPTDLLIKIETDRLVAKEQVVHPQGIPASSLHRYSRPTWSPSRSSGLYIYCHTAGMGGSGPSGQTQLVTPSYIICVLMLYT